MSLASLAAQVASRLALTRPLVCLDLEATGLWTDTDRIVQIATLTVTPEGRVTPWSSLVHPEQPMPSGAVAVHGITDAMVADAPTFAQLGPTLTTLFSGADLAGYNIRGFDRPLLSAEFRRAGLADPTASARLIDAYTIFVRQEPRHLDAALRFYGLDAEAHTPHDARSDAAAALGVLAAQLTRYPDLPTTVEGVQAWLYPPDPDRIDPEGKLRWRDDVAIVAFGRYRGRPFAEAMASDRAYFEELLEKDFPEGVKAIVRDALAGRWPGGRGDQNE